MVDYSLPPTLGMGRHDPRKEQAPAFSFGSRYLNYVNDSPGPAYGVDSAVTHRGRSNVRGFVFNGRPVHRPPKNITPGPMYQSDALGSPRNKRAPAFTIGRRSFQDFSGPAPGPGAYQLPTTLGPRVYGFKGSRAAELRGRSDLFGFSYDWAKTPGPGAYDTSRRRSGKRREAVTLKGRNFRPDYFDVTPGPGSYETGSLFSDKKKSPRYTIGVKHSEKALPFFTMADVGE